MKKLVEKEYILIKGYLILLKKQETKDRHSLIYQPKQITVPFALHIFPGHKAQGRAVDAIALPAGFPRAIVKHMPQVRVARAASHLGPQHTMGSVFFLTDNIGINGPRKAGPAAAGIKLVGRGKKRFTGDYIHIYAGAETVPELVMKSRFGAVFMRHLILRFSQGLAQLFWVG